MSSLAHTPDAAQTAIEQPILQLTDFDETVLTHILARLHNPLPFALTCKPLWRALNSQPCRLEWFDRWKPLLCARCDPVALALLAWKPLAGYDLKHLSTFMLHTVRRDITLRKQYTEALQQSVEFSRSQQWIELYKLFVPWPEHLLLLATAASPHSNLLSEMLRLESQISSSPVSFASDVRSTTTSALPGSAAAGAPVLQPPHSTAPLPFQQSPAANGEQQRNKAFLRALPKSFHLPTQQHDYLQSALLSAAAAGQHECLKLLLDQWQLLLAKQPYDWERDGPASTCFMVGLIEAAAAAGDQRCLDAALLGVATGVYARMVTQHAASQHPPAHHQSSPQQQDEAQLIENIRQRLYQRLHQRDYRVGAASAIQLHSNYCLVAAAGSGSCKVVDIILHLNTSIHVKQQLPAALTAAGRRGHLEVLKLLLELQEVSSKPLEMAATDAAVHPWPLITLDHLLKYMAEHYRIELLQLLHKPLLKALQSSSVLQQQQQTAATVAILECIKSEAVTDAPELLGDVLLLLAQQGDAASVSWVLQVAPTVLVKVGTAAVAAALEGGHPQVAQIIMDAGGERPEAFKAAAKRGDLVTAVRKNNLTAVKCLLKECSLPLLWSTDRLAASCDAGGVMLEQHVLGYGDAPRKRSTAFPTSCLLHLLKTAAATGAPESVLLLRLLLPALPTDQFSSSRRLGKLDVVAGLIEFCLAEGLVEELETVFGLCAGTARPRARIFKCLTSLKLPEDICYMSHSDSDSSCAGAAAVPRPIAAAIALMRQSGGTDLLSLYVAPLMDAMLPYAFPGQFMLCKKGLKVLLQELASLDELPASAKVKNVVQYKLMVRVVLQSADVMLLHAFLRFMDAHGSSMLVDVVEQLEQDESAAVAGVV